MTSQHPESLDSRELMLFPEKTEFLEKYADRENLRVGYVPGVMPGKWFGRWHERYDSMCPLVEVPLVEDAGLASLTSENPLTHMVLLRPEREPASLDRDRFHAISLYREKQVVVLPKDHLLTLHEEAVPLADLAEEFMLQEPQTVPAWAEISADFRAAHPQKLPEMRHTKDAVELVAAGLGLLLVPMSVARFYHRKDLTYRVVEELPETEVALVWERKVQDEAREQVLQDFVGICRGRRSGSERGSESKQAARERAEREKAADKRKRQAANARREARDRKSRNARKNGGARQHAAQTKRNAAARKKKR